MEFPYEWIDKPIGKPIGEIGHTDDRHASMFGVYQYLSSKHHVLRLR